MHIRTTVAAVAVAAVCATAALAACDPATDNNKPSSPTATATASARTSAPAEATAGAEAEAAVPKFTGMGLQSAQDTAQAAGFHHLTSHDALGRGRHQLVDRNWKVCSQNHAPGKPLPTSATLDFGAVKVGEECPAKDQAAPDKADSVMPDFHGKSLKVAKAAIAPGTPLTSTDAKPDHRIIVLDSNWQVCAQSPAAGTALSGQPVAFTAVKFGETCPRIG